MNGNAKFCPALLGVPLREDAEVSFDPEPPQRSLYRYREFLHVSIFNERVRRQYAHFPSALEHGLPPALLFAV